MLILNKNEDIKKIREEVFIKEQGFQEEFDEIVSSKDVCVIDFSASWCGPCRMMAPILEDVSEKYKKEYLNILNTFRPMEAVFMLHLGVKDYDPNKYMKSSLTYCYKNT